jgi:cysteinyl-tRNA synthetase
VKPFQIFNTLSRSVEQFEPLDCADPPTVTFYSCGPTVYLPQHLGNMRAYVFVDTAAPRARIQRLSRAPRDEYYGRRP